MKYFVAGMLLAGSIVSNAFICPKSLQNVPIGATEQQVAALCGQPIYKSKPEKQRTYGQKQTEIWSYEAKKFFSQRKNGQMQMSPAVSFAFQSGVLVAIKSSGVEASTLNRCGMTISVGSTTQSTIESSCGAPAFKSQQAQSVATGTGKSSIWVYQFAPYQPKKLFRFFNGRLQSIQ